MNHIEKHVKIKTFGNILMHSEDTEVLEFNQYQKSDKESFIVYTVLHCLIEKIDWCKNYAEKLLTAKVGFIKNKFHQVFQCVQYHHLSSKNISMIHTKVKIV